MVRGVERAQGAGPAVPGSRGARDAGCAACEAGRPDGGRRARVGRVEQVQQVLVELCTSFGVRRASGSYETDGTRQGCLGGLLGGLGLFFLITP